MMRRALAFILLVLALGIAAAGAAPPFKRGGQPTGGGGGGTAYACGSGGVCADFAAGQAFVTWPDAATGASGANYRYRVYRSNSPITSGNYTSAVMLGSYIPNNSGQLVGGDPETAGSTFTQAARQSNTGANVMAKIPDAQLGGTKTLAAYTGLHVHTAEAAQDAYYAVVSTDTSDANPAFVGAVGPIAESVAAPQPVKYAASGSRTNNTYGTFTSACASNCPVVLFAHQSSAGGGPASWQQYGDYYTFWGDKTMGWQEGRQMALNVHQDNAQHFPSLPNSIEISNRDTVWNPAATGGFETYHGWLGLTPNPLVGAANRVYPITANGIRKMLDWSLAQYGANSNKLIWWGRSMGAWGAVHTGLRMTSPRFASLWADLPIWRFDRRPSNTWAGSTWNCPGPFCATLGSGSTPLGSTLSAVAMPDGSQWGGGGGYVDMPGFVAANPGADLPVMMWVGTKDDLYPASFLEHIEAKNAFQSARRGHGWIFYMGQHNGNGLGVILCGSSTTPACYSMNTFALNAPYIATSNSSIDDNPGTGARDAQGIYDGDYLGSVNLGFRWTITSDTASAFNFTIDNTWMDQTPTAFPATTIAESMAASNTGVVTVADSSVFMAAGSNPYFMIGSGSQREIVYATTTGGNTVTISLRGMNGSSGKTHSSGEPIIQFYSAPTGPNGGPYSTMTADLTPRRVQSFLPAPGATVNCTVTPDGGSPASVGVTVDGNGLWTLPTQTINASGATSVACGL